MKCGLLVFDADNTLWDTDEIYASAQLELLANVQASYGPQISTDGPLEFVRKVDQVIACQHPSGLRYPPELLVKALAFSAQTGDVMTAVTRAFQSQVRDFLAKSIADAFVRRISEDIPRLRLGVAETVPRLVQSEFRMVILTESSLSRCMRLLDHHGLGRSFVATISEKKSIECYAKLLCDFPSGNVPVMIGDQLDRDIEYSKAAGYTTIHFPGGFNPFWISDRHVIPDYLIQTFEEIPGILDVCLELST
jgi:putative hydrolase of the HAD superfamily